MEFVGVPGSFLTVCEYCLIKDSLYRNYIHLK